VKVGKIYKIQNSVYDVNDTSVYVIIIKSEKESPSLDSGYYYDAEILNSGYKFHFYPEDWRIVRELSNLELELL
jgi:hypothetical protein